MYNIFNRITKFKVKCKVKVIVNVIIQGMQSTLLCISTLG